MTLRMTIDDIREKLINVAVLGGIIFLVPGFLLLRLRLVQMGWQGIIFAYIGLEVILGLLFIFRTKVSLNFKAHIFSLVFLTFSWIELVNLRLSESYFAFMIVIVVGTFLLGRRIAIIHSSLFLLGFLSIAYLSLRGAIISEVNVSSYISLPATWFTLLVAFIFIDITLIHITGLFFSYIAKKVKVLEDKSKELNSVLSDLRYCDERFTAFMNNMPAYTYIKNDKLEHIYHNRHEDALIKLSENKNSTHTIFRKEVSENLESADKRIFSGESKKEIIDYQTNLDNKLTWLRDYKFPIDFPDGNRLLGGMAIDITQEKESEISFLREKKFSDKIINSLPGIFYLYKKVDNTFKLVQWNKNHEILTGYSGEELLNTQVNRFFDKSERVRIEEVIKTALEKGSASIEVKLRYKNGEKTPYYLEGYSFFEDKDVFILGVGRDISELKKNEKALKESEEKFRNIFNNTADAIVIVDEDLSVLAANDTFFGLTNFKKDEISSIELLDFILDEDAVHKVSKGINNLVSGNTTINQYTIKDKHGKILQVEVKGKMIMYEGNRALLISLNNITDKLRLEKEIYVSAVNAEEQERGRIARELHDGLGPLLSTCRIYIYDLKKSDVEAEIVRNLEELINEALNSIKEISNNISPHILRNFGLLHAVNSFIDKNKNACNFDVSHDSEITKRFDELIETTTYRVIIELINNTLKHSGAKNINISFRILNEHLVIEYLDDGAGFNFQETLLKSKGFGLINIHARITSIGGTMNYVSSSGKGVNVTIKLKIK